jgi:hypothetical protein
LAVAVPSLDCSVVVSFVNFSKKAKSLGVTAVLRTESLSSVKVMVGTVVVGWKLNFPSYFGLSVMLLAVADIAEDQDTRLAITAEERISTVDINI